MTDPIRIGHIALSFRQASALEVARVLESHGHSVTFSSAPHEEAFKMLGRGEIDILASAWLPSSHEAYLEPMLEDVDKVAVIQEPYCLWGVPDHVPESAVASVTDLLLEPAIGKMEPIIQGINPGAGISRFSADMIKQYGLGAAGYVVRTGSEADCFDRYEAAVAEGHWVVVPLWHPQFLHHRYSIRALKEPKGLLGSRDEATLIVRKDARLRIGAPVRKGLSRLHIGNPRLSELEDGLRRRA